MPTITNTHPRTPRGLPLLNRKHITIAPGATVSFPDADYQAIKGRKDISHLVSSGILRVEGFTQPAESEPPKQEAPADQPVDAPAAKPAKAKKG